MIEIITADIAKLKVDAIVNAANCSLPGGGGQTAYKLLLHHDRSITGNT